MSIYRDELEKYLKTVDIDCNCCLDIGGSSYPISTPGRLKSFKCSKYIILDNLAEEKYEDKFVKPDIECDLNKPFHYKFKVHNSRKCGNVVRRPPKGIKFKSFDIVFALEILEYIYDPMTALRFINSILKRSGLLYITFPTSYCYHAPAEIDSLRYYKPGIRKLLKEAQFEIQKIIPRKMTKGKEAYAEFIRQEGLHPVRHSDDVYDLGYIIKAVKK